MKNIVIKINLLLFLVATPFLAIAAQESSNNHDVEIHLIGGYTILDTYGLANIENAFQWKFKTSFMLVPRIQMGVSYTQARSESIIGEDAFLRSLQLEPLVFFLEHRFSPYVKVNLGYQWVDFDQIDKTNGLLYGAGLGFRSAWDDIFSTWIGIDADLVNVKEPIDEMQVNWFMYIGTSLRFGSVQRYNAVQATTAENPSEAPVQSGLIEPQVCKNVPAGVPVDEYGCPLDFDEDNVPDYDDYCPATQTKKVDHMGCPIEHFARGILQNLSFESGSARLTSTSYQEIKKIASALKRFSTLHFVVEGHTDSIGDRASNLTLSKARAQTVVNALIEFGIPKDSISAVGYGQQYPIATNNNEEGRKLNRRIEIKWKAK